MNRFRYVTMGLTVVSVLLTWTNNFFLDIYLISHPVSFITFIVTVSIEFFHITTIQKYYEPDSSNHAAYEAYVQTKSLTQSFMFNSILSACLFLINVAVQT